MLSRNMTDNVHQLIKMHLTEGHKENLIAVDGTLGNGFDLEFLNAQSEIACIYGFDIQEEAIRVSKERIAQSTKDIHLIHDSHANLNNYVHTAIDLAMFNLGYLPGGDKHIVTKVESSLEAIDQVIEKLAHNGMLVIMTYPGHGEGMKEHESIQGYLQGLHKKELSILQLAVQNVKKPCPNTFLIIKKLY